MLNRTSYDIYYIFGVTSYAKYATYRQKSKIKIYKQIIKSLGLMKVNSSLAMYDLDYEINYDPTKNALKTIRIPLSQFQDGGAGLTNVKKIIFLFPTDKGKTGKVNLSNLIITN